MLIEIDTRGNRVLGNNKVVSGTGRWEVAVLDALMPQAATPLSLSALHSAMARAGRRLPADRSGVRKIWIACAKLVDELLGHGAFNQRFVVQPRSKTIGPWRWNAPPGERWQLLDRADQPAATPEESSSSMPAAWPGEVTAPLDLICAFEHLFSADSLQMRGELAQAQRRLDSAAAAAIGSPVLLGLIELRQARVLKRQGQYDDSIALAKCVVKRASAADYFDCGQIRMAQMAIRRSCFDRAPNHFTRDDSGLVPTSQFPIPDPRVLAPQVNLEALKFRRQALAALATGEAELAQEKAKLAWRFAVQALYWAASKQDLDSAENYCFNMGLVQATLADAGDAEGIVVAFACYRLGLQLGDDFVVGQDSVWNHIFITNLWLSHPSRRSEFERVLATGRFPISDPRLRISALETATVIGEPGQIGLCCMNLWRVAGESPTSAESRRLKKLASESLKALGKQHPRVLLELQRDGATLVKEMTQ